MFLGGNPGYVSVENPRLIDDFLNYKPPLIMFSIATVAGTQELGKQAYEAEMIMQSSRWKHGRVFQPPGIHHECSVNFLHKSGISAPTKSANCLAALCNYWPPLQVILEPLMISSFPAPSFATRHKRGKFEWVNGWTTRWAKGGSKASWNNTKTWACRRRATPSWVSWEWSLSSDSSGNLMCPVAAYVVLKDFF